MCPKILRGTWRFPHLALPPGWDWKNFSGAETALRYILPILSGLWKRRLGVLQVKPGGKELWTHGFESIYEGLCFRFWSIGWILYGFLFLSTDSFFGLCDSLWVHFVDRKSSGIIEKLSEMKRLNWVEYLDTQVCNQPTSGHQVLGAYFR